MSRCAAGSPPRPRSSDVGVVDLPPLELPALLASDVFPALRALQRGDLAGADRALALGAGLFLLARRGGAARRRLAAAALAACWLWTGVAFHASRYATINFAAVYFAWAFGVDAALLT